MYSAGSVGSEQFRTREAASTVLWIEIRQLGKAQLKEAGSVLSDAFWNYYEVVNLLPNEAQKQGSSSLLDGSLRRPDPIRDPLRRISTTRWFGSVHGFDMSQDERRPSI
jgi:hypothetical protein